MRKDGGCAPPAPLRRRESTKAKNNESPQVTAELLARYDRPGPRYTSYPTAPEFNAEFGPDHYAQRLAGASERVKDPLSLYVHLPFCEKRCHFCGCHVVITQRDDVVRKYLDHLKREIRMVADALGERRDVLQFHWGGGTPTHLTPDQMRELFEEVTAHFQILPEAEVAIEVDPRVTSHDHVDMLVKLGFNRLSMGVQDSNEEVQTAIGREQTLEETLGLHAYAQQKGLRDINIDLVYGLPKQTVAGFRSNLDQVIALKPGRVAVYSYAHVPWIRPNQRRIQESDLPDRDTKFALFAAAVESFTAAGYLQIGMDHFARPEDELAQARLKGTLGRNFMGYTVKAAPDMVAFGVSGIGEVDGAYVQNVKKLSDYYRAVGADVFPVEKGFILDQDDYLRRFVIHSLMCNFELDFGQVEKRFQVKYDEYFQAEDRELRETIEPEFFERTDEKLIITPMGQLFIRNIVMVYDRYLKNMSQDKPIFSRTV
jgi:oxygen-independent coproporphyrinogen-3 oxidase